MTNIRKILFYALAWMLCVSAASARECQLKMVGTMDIVTGSDGRLLVPVTVEGQKGYFRFDIGASVSIILASATDGVGLKHGEMPTGRWLGTDGQKITETVTPSLSFGGVTGPVILGVTPMLEKRDPQEVGVLGFDVLRNFDVEMDFERKKINLFSPDHCPRQVIYWTHTAPVAALPMTMPSGADFFVTMQLDGNDVLTRIGTTEDPTFLSTLVAEKKFGLAPPDANALKVPPKPYAFKTLAVDGLTISNPVVYPRLEDPASVCNNPVRITVTGRRNFTTTLQCFGHSDLYLGLAELRKLRTFFDFSEKTLYATAADTQ